MVQLQLLGEFIPSGLAHIHCRLSGHEAVPTASQTWFKRHAKHQEILVAPDDEGLGTTVAWTQGTRLKQLMHIDAPVQITHVLWTRFHSMLPSDGSESWCCIFTDDGYMHLHSVEGNMVMVPLPGPVLDVWPLEGTSGGLLVETSAGSQWFTLSHPQDPWRPVFETPRGHLETEGEKVLAVCPFDQGDTLIQDELVVVTYSETSRLVSFYVMKFKAYDLIAHLSVISETPKESGREGAAPLSMLSEWSLLKVYSNGLEEKESLHLPQRFQDHFFGYHDWQGGLHIVLHDKVAKKAHFYAVDVEQTTEQSSTVHVRRRATSDALAVAGIKATRKDRVDLLLLKKDGSLLVEADEQLVWHCSIPLKSLSRLSQFTTSYQRLQTHKRERDISHRHSDTQSSVLKHARVMGFRDATDNNVTLILSNGSLIRARLDLQLRSTLVLKSLQALSQHLDSVDSHQIITAVVQRRFGDQPFSDMQAFTSSLWDHLQTTKAADQRQALFWNSLKALHPVYELSKLNVVLKVQTKALAELLCLLSRELGAMQYTDIYERDFILSPPQTDPASFSSGSLIKENNGSEPVDLIAVLLGTKIQLGHDPRFNSAIELIQLILAENEQGLLEHLTQNLFNVAHLPYFLRRKVMHILQCETLFQMQVVLQGGVQTKEERQPVQDWLTLIFPDDLRAEHVGKMLDSSKLFKLVLKNMDENDLAATQQKALMAALSRVFSLPFGRGLFDYRTICPKAKQKFDIPAVETTGRVSVLMTKVTPDPSTLSKEEMGWTEFHNGVAAGLSLKSDEILDASWVIYNRPDEPDNTHAGFLLGLGLNGHLKKMLRYQLFEYLNAKHDQTSIGLLLGLGGSYLGTMDDMVTKLISLHIPALLPPQSADLNLSSIIQSTAFVSLGLLYCGSIHRRMTDVMLTEIGRSELLISDAHNAFRESYSLSAGLALGLITLSKGEEVNGMADLHMMNRLNAYISGGSLRQESTKSTQRITADIQAHRFYDGNTINRAITSISALSALGLMFLKTGSSYALSLLRLPKSLTDLENYRADILQLTVVCRSFVMWHEIGIDQNQILATSLPSFVVDGLRNRENVDEGVYLNCVQAYRSIIAGSCFALALKFAGTHDEQAIDFILKHLDEFIRDCPVSAGGTCSIEKRMVRTVTMECIRILCSAAAIVASGSGNISVLRRLKILRSRVGSDISFGDHLAYHMSMGLLFAGHGQYTLDNTDESIAFLFCSFFPKYPSTVADHRTHNQTFRYLWALALRQRLLVTRDRVSGDIVSVPLTLKLGDTVKTMKTPCLIPTSVDGTPPFLEMGDGLTYRQVQCSGPLDFSVPVLLDRCHSTGTVDWRRMCRKMLFQSQTAPRRPLYETKDTVSWNLDGYLSVFENTTSPLVNELFPLSKEMKPTFDSIRKQSCLSFPPRDQSNLTPTQDGFETERYRLLKQVQTYLRLQQVPSWSELSELSNLLSCKESVADDPDLERKLLLLLMFPQTRIQGIDLK